MQQIILDQLRQST